MKKYIIIISLSALALIFLYYYQTTKFGDKVLHVVFCDVGQGDGILIRTPSGVDIVIDGGPQNGKMLKCLAEHMPFWDHDIELMFATHPDADHIGGLIDIVESYRLISFNTSTDNNLNGTQMFEILKKEVAKQKISFHLITAGDKFTVSDGVTISTVWPNPGFKSPDTNEYSLVQVLKYGNFEALFTGDITYQILDSLNFTDSFQVFKLPHHGSKTGTDEMTLEKIRSYLAIISDGYHNRYHHPHPSVLALLASHHLAYDRTDEKGTIEIVTDGKSTRVVNSK